MKNNLFINNIMGYKKLRKNAGEFLKASYESQADAEKRMSKKGYSYDKDLSTMESKVFVNKRGKATIVQRGSTRLSDWAEDGLIAVGLGSLGNRQKKAIELNKKVEENSLTLLVIVLGVVWWKIKEVKVVLLPIIKHQVWEILERHLIKNKWILKPIMTYLLFYLIFKIIMLKWLNRNNIA